MSADLDKLNSRSQTLGLSMNTPISKRHHYVPQFYLRQFACIDDSRKIMALERHDMFVVHQRKSISQVGFQDSLYDFGVADTFGSIEQSLNQAIETPFSQGPTWTKICSGGSSELDETDMGALHGFARHLQLRNAEWLRFIEDENSRYKTNALSEPISESEREMHDWLSSSTSATRMFFHQGALDRLVPRDVAEVAIMVCRSPIALRSSTNPNLVVSFPGAASPLGSFFATLRTWWLSLDKDWGVFIIAGGPSGFSKMELPKDTARMINRLYLVQQQHDSAARFLFAEDDQLVSDLEWAGYELHSYTPRRSRFRKCQPNIS